MIAMSMDSRSTPGSEIMLINGYFGRRRSVNLTIHQGLCFYDKTKSGSSCELLVKVSADARYRLSKMIKDYRQHPYSNKIVLEAEIDKVVESYVTRAGQFLLSVWEEGDGTYRDVLVFGLEESAYFFDWLLLTEEMCTVPPYQKRKKKTAE